MYASIELRLITTGLSLAVWLLNHDGCIGSARLLLSWLQTQLMLLPWRLLASQKSWSAPLSWSRYSWKLHHHVDRRYNVFVQPFLERASLVLYEEFVCLAMSFFEFASRV